MSILGNAALWGIAFGVTWAIVWPLGQYWVRRRKHIHQSSGKDIHDR